MNPNFYLYSKLSQKINNLKKLEEEINLIQEDLNSIKNKNIEDRSILQKQFENYYSNFTRLMDQKNNLECKESKNEFIKLLENDIKNFDNPDECFNRFKVGKINYDEFKKQFSELGKGKNYHYYKLIHDKINQE